MATINLKKRFISMLCVLCLTLGLTSTAFAKESDSTSNTLNTIQARTNNYNSLWVNPGYYYSKSFTVYNTGNLGVTWKVESTNNNSYAQIRMTTPSGSTVLHTAKLYPSNGDHRFRLNAAETGPYTINFMGEAKSTGMRVLCWFY